jgi:hypothetical protein
MIEKHLDIPSADGDMNTFVVHPEEGGPHPLVLWSGSSTCSGEPSIGNQPVMNGANS